jgi:hypothetical protein
VRVRLPDPPLDTVSDEPLAEKSKSACTFTTTGAEVDAMKFESPLYAAVMLSCPAGSCVVNVTLLVAKMNLPSGSGPPGRRYVNGNVPSGVAPLKKVTVPSGAKPPPFVLTVVVRVTLVVEVTPVVGLTCRADMVGACVIVNVVAAAALGLKLASPP